MTMPYLTTIASLGLIAGLFACGTDSGSHYDRDAKNYGKIADADAAQTKVGREKEVIGDLRVDPNELIFSALYRGYIQPSSIRFLHEGAEHNFAEFEESLPRALRLVVPQVESVIERYGSSHIDLVAQQTFGDGKLASFTQEVRSPLDSSEGSIRYFEKEGDSGFFTYDRVLDDESCPAGYVCISRLLSQPLPGQTGAKSTTCFMDPKTGKPRSIPYGVSPGIVPRDIPRPVTILGDFEIRQIAAEGADCATSEKPENPVIVRVTGVREDDPHEMKKLSESSLSYAIDFGVRIKIELLKNNGEPMTLPANFTPYLDDVVGMQANTTYYFNIKNAALVKISKEIRKGFHRFFQVTHDGVKLVVDFYLCEDYLQGSKNFCKDGAHQ